MRIAAALVVATLLVLAGWTAGRAQVNMGDFEIQIDASGGSTTLVCVRGCTLVGERDVGNPNRLVRPEYQYGCSAPRCKATVHGFVQRDASQ